MCIRSCFLPDIGRGTAAGYVTAFAVGKLRLLDALIRHSNPWAWTHQTHIDQTQVHPLDPN